jgi:hypothetical protein
VVGFWESVHIFRRFFELTLINSTCQYRSWHWQLLLFRRRISSLLAIVR